MVGVEVVAGGEDGRLLVGGAAEEEDEDRVDLDTRLSRVVCGMVAGPRLRSS
jgi:hypothetical protein